MKKSLEKKIEKYVKSTEFPFAVYYTECPINFNDDYFGCKYFFVYQNTHNIAKAFKTQWELEEFIDSEGV